MAFGVSADRVGGEDQQGDVVGPGGTDAYGVPDQRARRLQGLLDVGRRHVLPGGVDDQLLLAVDDPDVPVTVDLGDVAGAQPAVAVDRLRSAHRIVVVTAHDDR